jgi:hypothetical protein
MQATSTPTVSYTVMSINANVAQQTCTVVLGCTMNGQSSSPINMIMDSADLASFMTGFPTGLLTRHDDLETAVLNIAISKGLIGGTVGP